MIELTTLNKKQMLEHRTYIIAHTKNVLKSEKNRDQVRKSPRYFSYEIVKGYIEYNYFSFWKNIQSTGISPSQTKAMYFAVDFVQQFLKEYCEEDAFVSTS